MKNCQIQLKIGRRAEWTFFSKKYRWSTAHEKMFNTTAYYGNTSQNHDEISPHTHYKSFYQENKR